MRRFEVETMSVRRVTWTGEDGWPWVLHQANAQAGPHVELEHDQGVVRMTVWELRRLREAIEVLIASSGEVDPIPSWDEEPPRQRPRVVKPAKTGTPWTPEDEAVLAERHAAGDPPKAIAAVLERTKSGVEARLVKLGLMPPREDGWRALQPPAAPPGPMEAVAPAG